MRGGPAATVTAEWDEVSARFDRNFRFVPACSALIAGGRSIGSGSSHGKRGTPRHDVVTLSLDVPIKGGGSAKGDLLVESLRDTTFEFERRHHRRNGHGTVRSHHGGKRQLG